MPTNAQIKAGAKRRVNIINKVGYLKDATFDQIAAATKLDKETLHRVLHPMVGHTLNRVYRDGVAHYSLFDEATQKEPVKELRHKPPQRKAPTPNDTVRFQLSRSGRTVGFVLANMRIVVEIVD